MSHEHLRIAAFFMLAGAFYFPVIRWSRMSQPARYIAMFVLGAAFLFYLQHPTHTACEQDNSCDQSGM